MATIGGQHVFEVQVYLDDLDPALVQVELFGNGINGADPVRQVMTKVRPLAGTPGGYLYSTGVPADRAAADYTARIIPHRDGVAVPLEAPHILWQR
jgi:starch phosphorylase